MMPSKKEYTLGKGSLYLSTYDPTTGLLMGERHMGHCKSLTGSNTIDYIDHDNHLSKMVTRDVHFPLKSTPTFKAELDEMSPDNQALSLIGTLTRETQQAGFIETTLSAFKGRRTDIGRRKLGLYHLQYQASASPVLFAPEETVTGPTGEGVVIAVSGTASSGTLVILLTSGSFATGDALSGSVAGDALAAGSAMFKPGLINMRNAAGTTTYAAGTDYIVSVAFKDDRIGRFYIPDSSPIADKATVKVRANYAEHSFSSISAYTNLTSEHQLRYVSDHALGRDMDFIAWRVTVSPDGDRAYIGDDWTTLSLMFEVLSDAVNHPEHPYFKKNIEDLA